MYLWFYFLVENDAVFILHSQDKFLRTTYIQLVSWATRPARFWVSLCPLLFASSLKWRFFSLLPHHNILHRIITVHCFSWTLTDPKNLFNQVWCLCSKELKNTGKYKHSLIPSSCQEWQEARYLPKPLNSLSGPSLIERSSFCRDVIYLPLVLSISPSRVLLYKAAHHWEGGKWGAVRVGRNSTLPKALPI